MKKTISGKVIMVNDGPNVLTAVIETEPATQAIDKTLSQPAKRIQMSTNDHKQLEGLARGKKITITLEQ